MAPSTTIRRLLKEVSELSSSTTNPNPTFYAAPVSDSDLHEWHFTLLGPPAPSPFAGGLYHGRISLPAQYPLKPPNFRFLTPSGRFEVNREICLSISGFHEETWMPAWGVRTALVALRSFMAEAGTAGQVGGLESSPEVRRRLAAESRIWKCGECGKTNEEVMKEWWVSCREAGVKVDEEGGMDLEAPPAEFELKDKGKASEPGKDQDVSSSTLEEGTTANENQATSTDIKQDASGISATQSTSETTPTPAIIQDQTTSPSAPQSPAHYSQAIPDSQPQTPQTISAQPSSSQRSQSQNQQPQPETITLDRAITAVFLALCLMILKKIFYPATTSSFSGDELRMVRDY